MCCSSGSELHFKDVHRKKGGGWMVHMWRHGLIFLSDNGYEQSVRTAVTHTISAVCSLIFDSRFQKDSSWLTRICSHFLQPSNFLFFQGVSNVGKKWWVARRGALKTPTEKNSGRVKNKQALPELGECEGEKPLFNTNRAPIHCVVVTFKCVTTTGCQSLLSRAAILIYDHRVALQPAIFILTADRGCVTARSVAAPC